MKWKDCVTTLIILLVGLAFLALILWTLFQPVKLTNTNAPEYPYLYWP